MLLVYFSVLWCTFTVRTTFNNGSARIRVFFIASTRWALRFLIQVRVKIFKKWECMLRLVLKKLFFWLPNATQVTQHGNVARGCSLALCQPQYSNWRDLDVRKVILVALVSVLRASTKKGRQLFWRRKMHPETKSWLYAYEWNMAYPEYSWSIHHHLPKLLFYIHEWR